MQYPQIQFYRGSLVRLASGKLKQVEDLSSDDFIESARLASGNSSSSSSSSSSFDFNTTANAQQFNNYMATTASISLLNNHLAGNNQSHSQHNNINAKQPQRSQSQPQNCTRIQEEINNNSVFNSPEPTTATHSRSSFNESPTMGMDIEDSNNNNNFSGDSQVENGDEHNNNNHEDDHEEIDVELDVVTTNDEPPTQRLQSNGKASSVARQTTNHDDQDDDFYIDSSVVRDFLEVGPIVEQQQQKMASASHISQMHLSCASPSSSTGSLAISNQSASNFTLFSSMPSTSKSSSSSSLAISPPIVTNAATVQQPQTVLIKFFLETSRSVAFIEVPIEHPFFVFHRGWSSWNPQKTYDKFGLKCRKLKIGDTCISLIRKKRRKLDATQQQESDQCNIMFSSIKIHE